MFILHDGGKNGKTVFLEGLRLLLGDGYTARTLTQTLSECCVQHRDNEVSSRELYDEYKRWSAEASEQQISHRRFSMWMEHRAVLNQISISNTRVKARFGRGSDSHS